MQWTGIMRRTLCVGTMAAVVATAGVSTASAASSDNADNNKARVDVLNWWTSGSEAKAMGVLQQMLAEEGVKMVNDAVAGGGGANARAVLKSRIQSGNAPGYAQIKGPAIQQWCETGLTGNIDAVAKAQNWSDLLAPRIAKGMKCDGHWVAVPFNIHRINWLWVNKSLLQKAGAEVPHSWSEFVSALKKLKQAGIVPLANGGGTWAVATLFDAVVSTVGSAQFYRNAFVKLKADALSSDQMVKAFKRLRTLQKFISSKTKGLSWNRLTHWVVNGKAAMQVMGDWAKGEITIAGATPGKEIACVAVPGSKPLYIYNIDSFVVFETDSKAVRKGQKAFARMAMSPKFQRKFNLAKGSIPVREGVSLKGFDACAEKSAKAYKLAKKHDALVPSFSQDMAEVGAIKGAIFDVVTNFFHSPNMSAEAAVKKLTHRVELAQRMVNL